MPRIYRVQTSEDTEAQGFHPSLAGAVTFDGQKTGKLTPGEYQALLIGDEIKPLRHPAENSTLKAHNQTYLSASLQGRLLKVDERICLQCGSLFDSPRIVFSPVAGCLPALILGVIVFILLRFIMVKDTGSSAGIAYACVMAGALSITILGNLYVRVRFTARQKKLNRPNCPNCGASKPVSICSIEGKRVEIGSEGKWVQVSAAGIS